MAIFGELIEEALGGCFFHQKIYFYRYKRIYKRFLALIKLLSIFVSLNKSIMKIYSIIN